MSSFNLVSNYKPRGDQPKAINALCKGLLNGKKHQVLLGVTGSGKTFTIANVVARLGKPALILAPNKTLAAQLFNEFKSLFPDNAVEYFVSYYDYYQPEAYIPSSDTYIQKDSSMNEMIDKLRHSATRSVLSRRDAIVVASVSCIYGLGDPEEYLNMCINIKEDMELVRDKFLSDLVAMHYERNDVDFHRGIFRVRGDRVEILPAYEDDLAVRIDFFGDQVERISEIDPLRGVVIKRLKQAVIYPASHYVTGKSNLKKAAKLIKEELKQRIAYFRKEDMLIEAQRIEERTNFDLEMMHEIGYCNGIENYSRYLTGRSIGEPPPTLIDYLPDDFLICIDESHIAVPQVKAMYKGDRSRKETLVRYGFRLPSAMDNRPLKFEEFESEIQQAIYISATPADYELEKANGSIVEQVVRPTGLVDPEIYVRKAGNQVDDLFGEVMACIKNSEKVLVTTLTKRMAEDLTEYYSDLGIRVRYLHADIKTLERVEIIRDLRADKFDVLIGINLLREGLDIPEVALVAILDADKEGFLRSARSLIQTCGRAARNVCGRVIMYADKVTKSMRQAINETGRRRKIQEAYNKQYDIVPQTITKNLNSVFDYMYKSDELPATQVAESLASYGKKENGSTENFDVIIKQLENEMEQAAKELAFERAAEIRDQIKELNKLNLYL
ncbi:excinuclease ABC subunit B [Desulfosarcina sp. BuS5]|uniref:excinuclease ABC subunit UvrB n=1 Tax=Desulfosarcina sp. BuS5 TaxID=933262 RepID=UPI000489E882|nr:excinuclease ABC subunit UvrB [Desulfosarcina sp. BuS5]WDN89704.1 excinuclease ABC subunit B [Desulfosarcina sp. BuS5]